MPLKTLNLAADLREMIPYPDNALPIAWGTDYFDDYAGMEWSCHWHDEFEILLVEQGHLCCSVYEGLGNPTDFSLKKGDVLFINTAVLHAMKALERGSVSLGVILPLSFFAALGTRFSQPVTESGMDCMIVRAEDAANPPLAAALRALTAIGADDPTGELQCIELGCRIWRRLTALALVSAAAPAHQDTLAEARVKQMIAYIHEHFPQRIAAADLARHAGISRTECFKCFARVLGKTPIAVLNEYRLSTAAMLLTHSTRSITEIALSCGFCDTSYFTRQFRQAYGQTPSAYRCGRGE